MKKYFFLKLILVLLFLLPKVNFAQTNVAPEVIVTGNQIYCPGTHIKIVSSIDIIDPDDLGTEAIYIQISSGYVKGQDQLRYIGTDSAIRSIWDDTTGTLKLSNNTVPGAKISYLKLIAAINEVAYKNSSATPSGTGRSFSINVGQANYLPSTQHYYMYVPSLNIKWTDAKIAAENSTYYGLKGYLATILSEDEAIISGKQASGAGWIGGKDDETRNPAIHQWKWVTGPEGLANGGTGTLFWSGKGAAGTPIIYANWDTPKGEPNSNDEYYAHITDPAGNNPGAWNNLTNIGKASGSYQPKGYIVEYGGMPGDPILKISGSTTIAFPGTITSTTPNSRCGTGNITLHATASSGATINWYDVPTGGTSLHTGTSFTTPIITATTKYYVDASTCGNSTRTEIIATINTVPAITLTTPNSRCDTGTVILGATASDGIINWYDIPNGGISLGTGTSFTTPTLTTSTKYYVDASANGCTTPTRTEITATINTTPTITSTTPASRCDTGTVLLGANASDGIINWYDVPNGGISLGNGTSFTTPIITTTTKYYVDASANGCTTPIRTEIEAIVNISPTITSTTPASRCDTGTVTLGSTASTGTINWYDVSTGGNSLGTGTSFTTSIITATTKYYVDATATGCTTPTRTEITATINTTPTITSATPAFRCDAGTLTLGATSSAGTINWYDVPTGGNLLGTGTSFTTPTITTTTKYYVDATATGCTTSTRTEVIASINAVPTITSTTPNSRCDSGTVALGATASVGIINWYNVPTGGSSLGTGTSFTTPSISATTKYYVDATAGCTTLTRTEITATINNSPTITSTTPASHCETGTVTLGATASSGTINWYDVPNGGNPLGTGASFTTPTLTATTKYYVDATASVTGCITPTRTEIIATINTIPTITSTTPSSHCGTGTVTLGANSSAGIINWYDNPTGGNPLGVGTSFTTPSITATTKYYADATANGCTTSTRTEIIATINTAPTITSTTPASRCDIGTVSLEALASSGIINWYDVPTGGTSLGTGSPFTTPSINNTTTFYVDATDNNCPSSRTPVVATVFPVTNKNEEVVLCESETVTLDASVSGMDYLWSPGGETTQTIVVTTVGDYSVLISSPLVKCDSKKDIKVIEHTKPVIKAIVVNENSIAIELTSSENYYEFSIDGEFFQDSNQFTHIPSGQHTAFVRAKYLCDMIQQDFTIFTISKYFTPNNDGYNDVWEIKEMKDYPNSSVLIFDRYGKLIKNILPTSSGWDGSFNNVGLPADDYWYHLKLDNTKPEIRGHFSLKR
ncbi:MAG: T9SS type B sorting domain-containing protein [Bacteroidota bacterium]